MGQTTNLNWFSRRISTSINSTSTHSWLFFHEVMLPSQSFSHGTWKNMSALKIGDSDLGKTIIFSFHVKLGEGTSRKSNIPKVAVFLRVPLPAFQSPSFWGPLAKAIPWPTTCRTITAKPWVPAKRKPVPKDWRFFFVVGKLLWRGNVSIQIWSMYGVFTYIYLDLFKVMFYGFYHGRSPLNNHLVKYVLSFFQAPKKQI